MSLVRKLMLLCAALLILALLTINIVVSAVLDRNNTDTIDTEQKQLGEICTTYARHTLLEMGLTYSSHSFEEAAELIDSNLYDMLGKPVALYSSDGLALAGGESFSDAERSDLEYALTGKSAYSLISNGNQTFVYCSFAVLGSDSGCIGVIRVHTDYSTLFTNSSGVKAAVLIAAVILLVLLFGMAVFFTARAARPINDLTAAIAAFPERPAELEGISRKDEIGVLARGYDEMSRTIADQLATINMEKEHLQKSLQYKKEFYDNVTHELKTPLTVILGYAEMMQSTGMSDKEFSEKGLGFIIDESRRLQTMVTELLEVSAAATAGEEKQRIEVSALLRELTEIMGIKAARYRAKIILSAPDEIFVNADKEKLRQLFINLIDNAIKYGEPGEHINISLERSAGFMQARIINRIREDDLDTATMFLPFRRLRSEKETGSVGLGLAICRSIVDALGGSIEAQSADEGCICMEVMLPTSDIIGS